VTAGAASPVGDAPDLVTREHVQAGMRSRAVYSACGAYRYLLVRRWGTGGTVNFVMLNPSTADECRNDPTVERCERRARLMGFGAFTVTNIFAWRATDPAALHSVADPTGPSNDAVLVETAREALCVIAAWGVHGALLGRGAEVAAMLDAKGITLNHLGLSRHGHPRHPLYLPYTAVPKPWSAVAAFT
jgi:hypothetical protein